jgi:hypothetical protein
MVSTDFIHSSMAVFELMVLTVAFFQLFLIGKGFFARYTTSDSYEPLSIASSRSSAPTRNVRSSRLDSVFTVGTPLPVPSGRRYLNKQTVMRQERKNSHVGCGA